MPVEIFRALWGMTGELPEQLERIAAAGYDGIEVWAAGFMTKAPELQSLLHARGLKLIMATSIDTQAEIEPTMKRLAEYQPLRINLHSGRDSFSRDEGCVYCL